ncbi:MAG: cation:proton antiporter [Candidatus Nitrospinota bacterium M3_3B_026]
MEHTADAEKLAIALMTLGALLLIGFAAEGLGRRTKLPRVTLMLLFGFLIGPSALDLLPDLGSEWFPAVADMALVMIGFLLGETLTVASLRKHGRLVMWISGMVVVMTMAVMGLGLAVMGMPVALALLLAGIAPATDPAATVDVIHETGSGNRFSKTLLGVVAVDDAWGLIAFSLMLAAAQTFAGLEGGLDAIAGGAWDLAGAVMVGLALGVPMAYATGRVRPGEPTLAEALGLVFLCGGVALWLDVSFLLAAMMMGSAVANLAKHHERPFHAIEGIDWPFMILFFILAGASLKAESLLQVGGVGLAYVLLRVAGRMAGAWTGAVLGGAEGVFRKWMGVALLPQAGVAMGMALVAARRFPDFMETILPVVIGATIFFEIIGPVFTRIALTRAGERKKSA